MKYRSTGKRWRVTLVPGQPTSFLTFYLGKLRVQFIWINA